jgi:hypothetical protein
MSPLSQVMETMSAGPAKAGSQEGKEVGAARTVKE